MDTHSKCLVYRNLQEYMRMLSNTQPLRVSITPVCGPHDMLFASISEDLIVLFSLVAYRITSMAPRTLLSETIFLGQVKTKDSFADQEDKLDDLASFSKPEELQ